MRTPLSPLLQQHEVETEKQPPSFPSVSADILQVTVLI